MWRKVKCPHCDGNGWLKRHIPLDEIIAELSVEERLELLHFVENHGDQLKQLKDAVAADAQASEQQLSLEQIEQQRMEDKIYPY